MEKKLIQSLKALLILFFFSGFSALDNSSAWTLKKDKDGIKVYTRDIKGSSIKSVKISTVVRSSASAIIAVLKDIQSYPAWVYNCKKAYLVKAVSPTESFQYEEISAPWPVENRDLIVHSVVQQNPANKEVLFRTDVGPDMVPQQKNLVRVRKLNEEWRIVPKGKDMVEINYEISTDPGGSVPSGILNAFIIEGPYNTIRNLLTRLNKPEYANAKLSYIKS